MRPRSVVCLHNCAEDLRVPYFSFWTILLILACTLTLSREYGFAIVASLGLDQHIPVSLSLPRHTLAHTFCFFPTVHRYGLRVRVAQL